MLRAHSGLSCVLLSLGSKILPVTSFAPTFNDFSSTMIFSSAFHLCFYFVVCARDFWGLVLAITLKC